MRAKYSFTFEFPVDSPITVKGEVEGGAVWTMFRRAEAEAVAARPHTRWSSCVCLLDRGEDEVGQST